ncbi:MAG: hypothetical protein ACYDES_07030 [Acidimicrobiales bacterium]
MIDPDVLARFEAIVDDSGVAGVIEGLLPIGVRPRQLAVRSLVVGMLAALRDHRPAHLSRVHRALVDLCHPDKVRLGIVVDFHGVPHQLTYRQVEYTFRLVARALANKVPGGEPSKTLVSVVGDLLEASIPEIYKDASTSLAVDWTDVETFASPVAKGEEGGADRQAVWAHRNSGGRGGKTELFFGYYGSLATMVADEGEDEVPDVVRAMSLTTCSTDPVPAFIPVLARLRDSGVSLGDVLADSGYAHRVPEHWAIPLRMLGTNIVTDLHPHDRGCQGTFEGATCFNGNLYCPATPEALFEVEPLPRSASSEEIEGHDARTAELSRYKLVRASKHDADGYHRVSCPAIAGKIRCPLHPDSMALSFDRPEVLVPPEHPPTCCSQATVTVPPTVDAKASQKHDNPSRAHRVSYARRTGVERSNSRIKDPATTDISRGWCQVMGLAPMSLFLACGLVVANLAVIDAFEERQVDNARRAQLGRPPRTRKRRRKTLGDLAGANAPPHSRANLVAATA